MLDPVQLETFLAVAQTRNFTEAGRRLGLRQSTVSQHIRKLEQASGRRLFVRDTHSVVPTADGEAMEGFAHSILEANERARRLFRRLAGARAGAVRHVGGFRQFPAAGVAARFRPPACAGGPGTDGRAQRHAVSALDAGELDLVLCKRRAGDDEGGWCGATGWPGSAPGDAHRSRRSRCR